MANKGSFLATGQYLDVGDYLVAANAQYFAVMQSDGNFVIYQGSDPAHQGTPIWATHTNDGLPSHFMPYFLIMQSDGNLVQYNGTGANPSYELPARWASNTMRAQGQYFALLRNDGHLVLSHTASGNPGDLYWDSQLGLITLQLEIIYGNNQVQRAGVSVGGRMEAMFDLLGVRLTNSYGPLFVGSEITWVAHFPPTIEVELLNGTEEDPSSAMSLTNADGYAYLQNTNSYSVLIGNLSSNNCSGTVVARYQGPYDSVAVTFNLSTR